MIRPQIVSVTCPSCRHRYGTRVQPLVDVTETPELKNALLQGRLNLGICPQCGMEALLPTPFLYVDREKELALVYMPQETGLDNARQQGVIGDLTNRLLNALPPEQRKAYLLQPRMFFTLKSLVEAVLEADGVTPEMMEASRARFGLLGRLLDVVDREETVKEIIREHDSEIDEEFYQALLFLLEDNLQEGRQEQAERLARLRDKIVAHSAWGQKTLAEAERQEQQRTEAARRSLLDEVIATTGDEELKRLVATGRPLIDYEFYQMLTSRMEAAEKAGDKEEAKRLSGLRDRVLDLTDSFDKKVRASLEQAGALLRTLLESENMAEAVHEHQEEVDQLLLSLVDLNIELASRSRQVQTVKKLLVLRDLVLDAFREKAPPPLRVLGRLVEEKDPEARKDLLRENKALLTQAFVGMVDGMLNEIEIEGDRRAIQHLQTIRKEILEVMHA